MLHEPPIITLQGTQLDMRLLELLHPGTLNNHRSVAIEITGEVNENKFSEALQKVMERHEVLHSKLSKNSKKYGLEVIPLDKIKNLPFTFIDARKSYSKHSLSNLYLTLKELGCQNFIDTPFDLYEGPLWRALLLRVADNKFQFLLLCNHIIVDEGSLGVIMTNLSHFYNSLVKEGNQEPLESLPSLLKTDFSLSAAEKSKRLIFWKKKLEHLNTIALGTDFSTQEPFNFEGKRIPFKIEYSLVKQIAENSLLSSYSLNQILLACLYTLLSRYSGEEDICLGITAALRDEKIPVTKMVDCFFKSIPLRLIFSQDVSFVNLVEQVRGLISESLKNQLALSEIMENGNIITPETKKTLSLSTPFNFLLVLNKKKPTLTLAHTVASPPVELDLGKAKLPGLAINVDELPDGSYSGFVEMNIHFKQEAVERFINYFMAILRYVAIHPNIPVSSIPISSLEDKQKLKQFNSTEQNKQPSSKFISVPDFFHSQAQQFTDKTLLCFKGEDHHTKKMTYGEVDESSTKIANFLKKKGVVPGTYVGISLTRSPHLYTSLFAILKSGGVFIPLENQACESLNHKVRESKMAFVIVDNSTQHLFANSSSMQVINLQDEKTLELMNEESNHYETLPLKENDPAYIMYTSGSTSNPKGVLLSHGGFANLMNVLNEKKFKENTRVLCPYLPTFDAFLYNLLVSLVTHGEVHFCFEEGRYSPQVINEMIQEGEINFAVLLPDLLSQLNVTLPLEDITSMGATPNLAILKKWAAAKVGRIVRTGYGLTEAGIANTLLTLNELDDDPTIIGQPFPNMQMFILTPDLTLCPEGINGEIFIAGPQVTLGFIGEIATEKKLFYAKYDDSLNRFVPCNQSESGAMRFFATGDEGCFVMQKNRLAIKLLGRKDKQIKMHGVRVDLGMIENLIREHEYIRDVVVKPNRECTQLTAYIVPQIKTMTFTELGKTIRAYIDGIFDKTSLPPVACPQLLTFNTEWPLTANGKINLQALPNTFQFVFNDAVKPRTPLQKTLRDIWANVLTLPKKQIGITKQFKYLGGDSHSLASLELLLNQTLDLQEYAGITILSPNMTIESLEEALIPKLKKKKPKDLQPIIQIPTHISIVGGSIFVTNLPSNQPNQAFQTLDEQNPIQSAPNKKGK